MAQKPAQKPTIEWEEVVTAPGNFVKFAQLGDGITGTVVQYDPDAGATTFDGDVCGHVVVQDDDGDWMTVSLDKGALRDKVRAAGPKPGDLIDIRYTSDAESKTGRTYKAFTVRIARGAGGAVAAPVPAEPGVGEEPF